jgi:hypothetical protein
MEEGRWGVGWGDIEYRNIGKKRLRVRKKKLVGSEQYQLFNNRGGKRRGWLYSGKCEPNIHSLTDVASIV